MRNANNAATVLANSFSIDMAASYMHLCTSLLKYDIKKSFHHTCVLSQRVRGRQLISLSEMGDLRMFGVAVDPLSLECYSVAHIMGSHFCAGQWGKPTCSSVFTCVSNGRSIYGRINKFLSIVGDVCPGYASVDWFGEPDYPLGDNKLLVVVSGDGTRIQKEVGSVIRITQIDPCCVVVEPDDHVYRMMRQGGYDTTR